MTPTAPLRRKVMLVVALLATAAVFVTAPVSPTFAAPSGSSTDDEGGTPALRKKLDEAARGYATAKTKLEASKKRQATLATQLAQAEARLTELDAHVQELAATSYRSGRLTTLSALLNSASPNDFLQRVVTMDLLTQRDDKALRDYKAAKAEAASQKAAMDTEVKVQTKQLADMEKKKREAEKALGVATGSSSGGLVSVNSPAAQPAPRNSDGSWPDESCSVNDPTPADGCITPRTLHALQQAQAAGFKRYVSCHRNGGSGEHPKGRACDFSAAPNGFENVNASGDDKDYGNRLAAYFIKNADRLGVMYVIWYARIWMPSTGWRSYSGCCNPAATHRNHVHLSML